MQPAKLNLNYGSSKFTPLQSTFPQFNRPFSSFASTTTPSTAPTNIFQQPTSSNTSPFGHFAQPSSTPNSAFNANKGTTGFGTNAFNFAGNTSNVFTGIGQGVKKQLWIEPKIAGPIKPPGQKFEEKDLKCKVVCVSAQVKYRNLSLIEMRCITFLQDHGLLEQCIQNGYGNLKQVLGTLPNQVSSFAPSTFPFAQPQSQQIPNNPFNSPFAQSQQNRPFNQTANIWPQQQQQQPNINVFNHNPFFNQPAQMNQPLTPLTQENLKQIQSMMINHMGVIFTSQCFFPLMKSYLESLGITNQILEYLIRIGLTNQQVQSFIQRWILLKNLEQERAKKFNFLSPYYNRESTQRNQDQNQGYHQGYQQSLFFPQNSRYPHTNNKFSRFTEFVMEHNRYSWEEQIQHQSFRNYLKNSVVSDPCRGEKIRTLMDELEEIEERKTIQAQRDMRNRRIQDLRESVGLSVKEEGNSMLATEEDIQKFRLNRIPIALKPYYMQEQH